MTAALITLAGVVIVALAGLAGTIGSSWMTKRSNDNAAVRAAQLEERKVNREDFDAITKNLWQSITDLNGRLDTETKALKKRAAKKSRGKVKMPKVILENYAYTARKALVSLQAKGITPKKHTKEEMKRASKAARKAAK